jgi:excisionase family DNA binding protein
MARSETRTVLPSRPLLTTGDVARAVRVDVKTVHNWVRRGLLAGSRTEGRHLRFERMEVIRALRQRGRSIPPALRICSPRVMAAGFGPESDIGLVCGHAAALLDAALQFVAKGYDVFAVNLDAFEPAAVRELVTAMRRHPLTQGKGLLGVSGSLLLRRLFIEAGGDAVVASAGAAADAVWALAGGAAPSPSSVRELHPRAAADQSSSEPAPDSKAMAG